MKDHGEQRFDQIKNIAAEIDFYTNALYAATCPFKKYSALLCIKSKIYELLQFKSLINFEPNYRQFLPTFSLDELAKYNGKNGNPAYVAVQGVVYDVSSNAAWAAATHFGLTAGNDLTNQFASCHPGQEILNQLKVVGRLV